MNELFNSTGGEPTKKARTLSVLRYRLKGLDFIIPIEEKLNTFTI
jgi:hypothetical protein